MRCKRGCVEEAAFMAMKAITNSERKAPPTWASIERSPAQGRPRGAVRPMMEISRQAYLMLDIDINATAHAGGVVAAKYKVGLHTLERRPVCDATGISCERFLANMEQ